jgi:hypothetical protein
MGATKENTGGSSNGENAWADSIETDETASRKEMPWRGSTWGNEQRNTGTCCWRKTTRKNLLRHKVRNPDRSEKSAQAQSENRIDLLILNQTNRANRQRKLRTKSSNQLRSEHE